MDIEILHHHLEKGVRLVQYGTGSQLSLPILGHLLLETYQGYLRVSATDLEAGVHYTLPCKIKKEGKTTVPAKLFAQFVGSLQGEKVRLRQKSSVLEVSTGTSSAKIKTLPADDFPIIPTIRKTTVALVPATALAQLLRVVVPFTATTEIRPELTGIFFVVEENGSITAATTDSFRLSEKTTPKGTAQQTQEFSCILPSKTANEIIRFFGDASEEEFVKIMTEETQVVFHGESTEIVTRLVEGSYPSYQSLIPESSTTTAMVNRQVLIEALKVGGIFTGTRQDVTIRFIPDKNAITVFGHDVEHGESEIVIEGTVEGKQVASIFNYRYLIEGLSSITTTDVYIGITDNTKPGVFKPSTTEGMVYILMPIKQ